MNRHYFLPRFCFFPALFAMFFSLAFVQGKAQVSLTPSNLTYTQNFDAFLGTAASVTNELPGWTVSANTAQGRNCGTSASGGLYAYGDAGDFSLGFLPASAAPNNAFTARVTFENNTGREITEVTISYNFERWRPQARLNGFAVTSNLGDVSALDQLGVGNTGSNCVVLTTAKTVTLTGLNVADGATFYVEFVGGRGEGAGSSQGVSIDDFELEVTLAPAPEITAGVLNDFGSVCINTTSAEQSFAVTGVDLSGDVTVTAPSGYEIATVSGGPYAASLLISPVLGEISETVYVVFEPVAVQSYNGDITLTGGGADPVDVAVSGEGISANPAISITSDAGANVCDGETVTFTATVTDGGSNPVYQWKLNGSDAGTNSNTYATNTLLTGDEVTCELISDAPCADGTPVVSNAIEVTVVTEITPTISISSDAGAVNCEGTEITFTATITDGGSSPVYHWKVNGSDEGTNSATFSSTTLNDGDIVTCDLTSNAACTNGTPVVSNSITLDITSVPSPSISISSDATAPVCEGIEITFTATITDGGSSPAYQWKVNGSDEGTNSSTFSSTTLNDGDEVTCELVSDAVCASATPVVSNTIEVEVIAIPVPTISISSDATGSVCEGTEITFTASVTDEGSNPTYQWKVNGSDEGTNSSTFSSTTLNDGDEVTAELVSDAACASAVPVVSNIVEVEITLPVIPAVSIAASPGVNISSGEMVTFTATPVNGGSSPAYQWLLNGNNVGTNSATYVNSTLNDGDEVSCILYSDYFCVSPDSAVSNILEIQVSTDVSQLNRKMTTLSVYPNPSEGIFRLKGQLVSTQADVKIEVLNAIGQVVYTETVAAGNGELNRQLSLTDVQNGLYFVRVQQGQATQVLRVNLSR